MVSIASVVNACRFAIGTRIERRLRGTGKFVRASWLVGHPAHDLPGIDPRLEHLCDLPGGERSRCSHVGAHDSRTRRRCGRGRRTYEIRAPIAEPRSATFLPQSATSRSSLPRTLGRCESCTKIRPVPAPWRFGGRDAEDARCPGTWTGRLYDRPVPSIADDLARVKLFSTLSRRQLSRLARQTKVRQFRPGVEVLSQDTMSGVGFFIVVEGEAAVTVDAQEVARLGPGDYFGELALVTEDARMATVMAVTRLTCHVIALWDFRKFAKQNPDVCWALLGHVAGLLAAERERRARAELALGLN